jgi:hypothetical protein
MAFGVLGVRKCTRFGISWPAPGRRHIRLIPTARIMVDWKRRRGDRGRGWLTTHFEECELAKKQFAEAS